MIQARGQNYKSTKLVHNHIILILIISYCLLLRLIDVFRRHFYSKCQIPMGYYGNKMGQLIGIPHNQINSTIVVVYSSRNMRMNALRIANGTDVCVM